ncbi:Ras domain-containing protein [Rhizoctonia solani AG-1 IA]|uniref:Ras domain-containing protein n=1 Tax=Thanatephorus cucumeris (strain AG1-IA) TaxID=983506 RepID=L8WVH1_THACA|nr:Ras domain-containing protein [Rhizoctonia solani AG-1 IA]
MSCSTDLRQQEGMNTLGGLVVKRFPMKGGLGSSADSTIPPPSSSLSRVAAPKQGHTYKTMAEPYDEAAATEMVEAYGVLFHNVVGTKANEITDFFVGEAGSGKSCLLHQFTQNSFKEHSQHTIGVEFSSRTINIGEKRVKLQLWDTAGQERFRSVTRSYYRGAAACLLVYDITSRSSFLNLSRWLADARALGSSQLVTVLVGNKTDREEEREVEWSEASKWASENGELLDPGIAIRLLISG